MPRFFKCQRGNDRRRTIFTLSNATSSVGQAALTLQAVSTPHTRALQHLVHVAVPRRDLVNIPTRTVRQLFGLPRGLRFVALRSATESSQTFPLTEADIPRIVDAVINGLQVGTQNNVALQLDDDGDPEVHGE